MRFFINRERSQIQNYRKILLGFFSLLLIVFSICSLAGNEAQARLDGELKAEEIKLSEESVNARGSVFFQYRDMVFFGDILDYLFDTEDLMMEGNLRIEYGDYVLSGGRLEGNLGEEAADIYEDLEFRGPDIWAVGNRMNYSMGEEIVKMQGAVEIEHLDLTARAGSLIYYLASGRARLEEQVEGTRNNQEFSADRVDVDTQEEVINLQGNASLIFTGEDEQ